MPEIRITNETIEKKQGKAVSFELIVLTYKVIFFGFNIIKLGRNIMNELNFSKFAAI